MSRSADRSIRSHNNERLPDGYLAVSRARVCPSCLRESNHCRTPWDLTLTTVCPVHLSALLETCPACKGPTTWKRRGVSVCACGSDLRQAKVEKLARSETHLSRLVYRRFGLMPSNDDTSTGNILYNFDLVTVFELLRLVSRIDPKSAIWARARKFSHGDTSEVHSRLVSAFSIFENWPTNFYSLLARIESKTKLTRAGSGIGSCFGPFYTHLLRWETRKKPAAQPLKAAFGKYLLESWDHGSVKRTAWLREKSQNRKYLTLRDAAHELGVSAKVVERLVKENKLTAVVKNPGRVRVFLIEAKSVASLKQGFLREVSLEAAARYLGVTRVNMLRLVRNDLITPATVPSINNRIHWKFEPTALENFLNSIRLKIVPVRPSLRENLQSFDEVLRRINERLSALGYGTDTFIDDILNALIVPRGESSVLVGIARLVFSRDEVERYIRIRERGRENERNTLKATCDQLQLKPETLWFLARKGLIKTIARSCNGIRYQSIATEAIFVFKSKYVFDHELAREHGVRADDLRGHLVKTNIKPVLGASFDYGPICIFRRSDVNRVNFAEISRSCQHQIVNRRERNGVGVVEAARILSLEPNVIIEMVRNDVLKPYSLRCSESDYRFNRDYVQDYKGQFRNPANLISKRVAGRILGRFRLHSRWLRLGHLSFTVSNDGRKRFLNKRDVQKIASAMAALATRSQTAELLGVNTEQIRIWTKQGLLRTVNNRFTKVFKVTFYSRGTLKHLKVETDQKGSRKRMLLVKRNDA